MRHGDGPGQCDVNGAREALIFEENGIYHLFYDGAGPRGWLACLATSTDFKHWSKKGIMLELGSPGEMDSASAISPWVYKEGEDWHMFYVGSPHSSGAPDYVPHFPYVTCKAKSRSLAGPWVKQKDVVPFVPAAGTYYAATASPGHIIRHNDVYKQFFSASITVGNAIKRTLGIARTHDLNGAWEIDAEPIVSIEEQIENSSIYYEPANQTWFLFTNHIGINEQGDEFTDAIWVYWSKDLDRWDERMKAVVLDGANCTWSRSCIGMPSVIRVGNRLAVLYDAPGEDHIGHMNRDIGLAWLELPLHPPG